MPDCLAVERVVSGGCSVATLANFRGRIHASLDDTSERLSIVLANKDARVQATGVDIIRYNSTGQICAVAIGKRA